MLRSKCRTNGTSPRYTYQCRNSKARRLLLLQRNLEMLFKLPFFFSLFSSLLHQARGFAGRGAVVGSPNTPPELRLNLIPLQGHPLENMSANAILKTNKSPAANKSRVSCLPRSTKSSGGRGIDNPSWYPSQNIGQDGFLKHLYSRLPGVWEQDMGLRTSALLDEPCLIRQVPGNGNCLFHTETQLKKGKHWDEDENKEDVGTDRVETNGLSLDGSTVGIRGPRGLFPRPQKNFNRSIGRVAARFIVWWIKRSARIRKIKSFKVGAAEALLGLSLFITCSCATTLNSCVPLSNNAPKIEIVRPNEARGHKEPQQFPQGQRRQSVTSLAVAKGPPLVVDAIRKTVLDHGVTSEVCAEAVFAHKRAKDSLTSYLDFDEAF